MKRPDKDRVPVCLGFDGSTVNDWTGIRLETIDGFQFTPRYGPDRRPTIWNPAEWNGRIPRGEVDVAVHEIYERFYVERGYFDPRDWETQIEGWALDFGDEHVTEWDTGGGSTRVRVVHSMLERFVNDLVDGIVKHDGCPHTTTHIANARKIAKPGEKFVLGKPTEQQKIDLAMASALCHEAACDARAAGWKPQTKSRMIVRR